MPSRILLVLERLIPTSFTIPEGYRREFLFEDPAARFKHGLVVDKGGIHVFEEGCCGPLTTSRCLDWIEDSINEVRRELGA